MQRKRISFEEAIIEIMMFSVKDIIQTSVETTDDPEESGVPTGTELPWDTSK